MTAAIRSEMSVNEPALYVGFELGKKEWKLGLTSGFGVKPWVETVASGDFAAVTRVLARARQRLGLGEAARVISCYEAGRDGVWVHRALERGGLENHVIDSASIEVNRRARWMKTDRLDAVKLVLLLVRVCAGDRSAWAEVPSLRRPGA